MLRNHPLPARAITQGPKHHFFGYYDKFQVDAAGRRMLVMETDFVGVPLKGGEVARIGVVDLADDDSLTIVAETQAWCWQQSCMLQWLPSAPDRKIIFNTLDEHAFRACVLDLESGAKRVFDRPIYCVSPDGRHAVAPNFARLAVTRPGYGYPALPDPWAEEGAPEEDGIYFLDLESGSSRLIISLAEVVDIRHDAAMDVTRHWINHLLFNPGGERFIFLHRFDAARGPGGRITRMFTANVDGGDIHLVNDHEMTSHFYWRDDETIIAWAKRHDLGTHYYLFTDRTGEMALLGPETLVRDGHMSYSDAHDWLLTDTYPSRDDPRRELLLYSEDGDEAVRFGAFYSPPELAGEVRCDLHPRWSRDGRVVTFDSAHEETRQVYLVDVAEIVAGSNA